MAKKTARPAPKPYMAFHLAKHDRTALKLLIARRDGVLSPLEYEKTMKRIERAGADRDREISAALAGYPKNSYRAPVVRSSPPHTSGKRSSWQTPDLSDTEAVKVAAFGLHTP